MTKSHISRFGFLSAGAAMIMVGPAAIIMPTAPAVAQSSGDASNGCESAPRRRGIGRSILGSVVGAATGRALGNLARFVPSAAVADTLTNAIACRLDEPEQLKAKDATLEATRSEQVGTQVQWQSETRPDVRGSSTIVARDDAPAGQPSGSRCMMIDDVIIVNGEETVSQKRMCRVPPETRYTLAA